MNALLGARAYPCVCVRVCVLKKGDSENLGKRKSREKDGRERRKAKADSKEWNVAGNEGARGIQESCRWWMLRVFFSSALVSLSDADRKRNTEGKCSASGDPKIYPPNLLSMDRAVASLQQI